MQRTALIILIFVLNFASVFSQTATIAGIVSDAQDPLPFANVVLDGANEGTVTDESGRFTIAGVAYGSHTVTISYVGFDPIIRKVVVDGDVELNVELTPASLGEVVVTGTLKEMKKLDSPVAVEVYQPSYFKRNPTPNMYEALQNINGVRPQLNCNVCNTGDIHINGLEGPYTMILIDGMPIVSGLATVYGLAGIPNSMIERIEIVKGPASTLYGSEAVGGLINVITKKPSSAPVLSFDAFATSWREYNTDVALKVNAGKAASVLTGINYFNYQNPKDNNGDNFTDVTLQDRLSVFQKWNFNRKNNRQMSMAARYLYEDRWGGELQWTPEFRGGDSIYAESIYTSRWEVMGTYQLPVEEKILLSVSANQHMQNSVYGGLKYNAKQTIGYTQLTWDKRIGRNDFLVGSALRYTGYDDNTVATSTGRSDTWLPGVFVQDEIGLNEFNKLLLGLRYDFNSNHGSIWTPRIAYKWSPSSKTVFRVNAGTGYRVVNLFTEDHAALTGAREVTIVSDLLPEQSYNLNINFIKKFYLKEGSVLALDATSWYTYFSNQILPDYDTDPNKIIYDNLNGHSVTRGFSLNADLIVGERLSGIVGGSFMDVFYTNGGSKQRPMLTEQWTGIWSLSYKFPKLRTTVDYTGNLYGPMRLPTLGPNDPRDEHSPWWSLQNIQITYSSKSLRWQIYGGIKNLLNYTPPANSIARSNDPFDKRVLYNASGDVIPTESNPNGLTFDPSYVFAPNQGIRGFMGVRCTLW